MEQDEDALIAVILEIKRLTDTFERAAIAIKKQSNSSGSHVPTGNQSYQDKELLPVKQGPMET